MDQIIGRPKADTLKRWKGCRAVTVVCKSEVLTSLRNLTVQTEWKYCRHFYQFITFKLYCKMTKWTFTTDRQKLFNIAVHSCLSNYSYNSSRWKLCLGWGGGTRVKYHPYVHIGIALSGIHNNFSSQSHLTFWKINPLNLWQWYAYLPFVEFDISQNKFVWFLKGCMDLQMQTIMPGQIIPCLDN